MVRGALMLMLAWVGTAEAHRLDEYQQAALVTVEPDHVELQLDLTPGIDTAAAVLAVIDGDQDGVITPAEGEAYAARVQQDLRVEVDGTNCALAARSCHFPTVEELKTGLAPIRLEWRVEVPACGPGIHRVAFQNSHWPALGVYVANAVVPRSPAMEVIRQKRGPYERSLLVEYRFR